MISRKLRRIVRRMVAEQLAGEVDELAMRAHTARQLAELATSRGTVYAVVFERDCDLCEATWLEELPALVAAVELRRARGYEAAEGPFSLELVSAADADGFEPRRRDLAAELAGY